MAQGETITVRVPHGEVLKPENLDYSDAIALGKVTVEYLAGPREYGIQVTVHDFDFAGATSCRDTNARAIAWARDALNAALEVDRLAPGGTLQNVAG